MNFDELNATIPTHVSGGKPKVLRYEPYPLVSIAMPGRHGPSDFVVIVSVGHKKNHQFSHNDIFKIADSRRQTSHSVAGQVMGAYKDVVLGAAPLGAYQAMTEHGHDIWDDLTLLRALQCLAVAEHRRYAQWEKQFGGRFLPFRFAAGIAEGLWTPEQAGAQEKYGRPGVERLERQHGLPQISKELMC